MKDRTWQSGLARPSPVLGQLQGPSDSLGCQAPHRHGSGAPKALHQRLGGEMITFEE